MQKNQSSQTQKNGPGQNQNKAPTAMKSALATEFEDAITINKKPAVVLEFMRNLENFRLFMKGVTEVKRLTPTTYLWTFGHKETTVSEWQVRVTQDIPGSSLSFESVEGSPVQQSATFAVSPATGDRGTVLRFTIKDSLTKNQYHEIFSEMTDDAPDVSAHTNMRRMKAFLETGEVPTTDGQSTGRDARADNLKH